MIENIKKEFDEIKDDRNQIRISIGTYSIIFYIILLLIFIFIILCEISFDIVLVKSDYIGGYLFFCCLGLGLALVNSGIVEKKIKKTIGGLIILIIAISLNVAYHISANRVYTTLENMSTAKPIIYLYPEAETSINVSLGNPELLTCTYPKYDENKGWNVVAEPNGDLKYGDRNLYALYWEGNSKNKKEIKDDGFIVKGEDTAKFLEEKLSILGLTDREAEEFIVYWLPRMEKNKYNYIRFETMDEIEENMPLDINPKPDTTIRVVMDWCEIKDERETENLKKNIKEQVLIKAERKGYVAVEWGGSKIK